MQPRKVDLALFAAQHGMIWVGLAEYSGWNTSAGTPEDVNRLGSWLGARLFRLGRQAGSHFGAST